MLAYHLETIQWQIIPDDCVPPGITGPTNPLYNTMWRVARHRKYTEHIILLTKGTADNKCYKVHTTHYTNKKYLWTHITLHITHKTLKYTHYKIHSTPCLLLTSALHCQFTPQITVTENWWDTMRNNFLTLGWEPGRAGEKHL